MPIIGATATDDPCRRDYFKPDLFNGIGQLLLLPLLLVMAANLIGNGHSEQRTWAGRCVI